MSPEIESTSPSIKTSTSETSENDGFYLVKKDSQRRATLEKVLLADEEKLCDIWIANFSKEYNSQLVLERQHVLTLIKALREYIGNQNKKKLEQYLNEIKKHLNNDIKHLQLVLFLFQEAVVTVLRSNRIQPHWMFALDNITKRAAEDAIHILSPELIRDEDENMKDSSSGSRISTESSTRGNSRYILQKELNSFRTENILLEELMNSRKSYQTLLKSTADEQNSNLELLQKITSQLGSVVGNLQKIVR